MKKRRSEGGGLLDRKWRHKEKKRGKERKKGNSGRRKRRNAGEKSCGDGDTRSTLA